MLNLHYHCSVAEDRLSFIGVIPDEILNYDIRFHPFQV